MARLICFIPALLYVCKRVFRMFENPAAYPDEGNTVVTVEPE